MSADEAPWHFLQSDLWAAQKSAFGWTPVRVAWAHGPVLVLVRRLPAGVTLAYVPYAPASGEPAGSAEGADGGVRTEQGAACVGVPGPDLAQLPGVLAGLTPRIVHAVRQETGRRPTVVRYDLPQAWPEGAPAAEERVRQALAAAGLVPAPVQVQPPDTVVIDLRQPEGDILSAMHKKNRYNIRLAHRKGVSVRTGGPAELSVWYGIYRETARRDGIAIHSEAYYRRLFDLAERAGEPGVGLPHVELLLAEHEGEAIAGIVTVRLGAGATYLYGASSNTRRNLMPNYALQWAAIERARAAGCAWYDLFGIPPADDPSHPMHGLYRFKTGFGGRLVRRLGAWDAIVGPLRGRAYRVAERARDVYFHRVRRHGAR